MAASRTKGFRRLLLLILFSLFFAGQNMTPRAASGSTTWMEPVQVDDNGPQFVSIHMVTTADGWSTAMVPGDVEGKQPLTYVLHTHDGGKTWTNVTPSDHLSLAPAHPA